MRLQTPVVHSVHFYDNDEAMIQRLGWIVFSGFNAGVSALLIMTPAHEQQFKRYMKKRGLDPLVSEREGQVLFMDAQETLNIFMREGMPDPDRFHATVGEFVRTARATSRRSGLTAFGEMVAILWREGNREGALALEALWNELLKTESFHLHCAYPRELFHGRTEKAEIVSVCAHHSIAVGHPVAA